MPSTAADAAGLLVSAIADPNPVVFVENKTLYFRRERVANGRAPVPLGRASVVRAGRDVTVVALSRLVHEALAAADELAADGIEVEVIDPRTLVPLDLETIVESVARTHRLVVAHEAVVHGGFGAELAAQVQAAAFDELDAPIVRVGAPFAPVPFSPPLEDAYLPGRAEVAAARARGRGTLMPAFALLGLGEAGGRLAADLVCRRVSRCAATTPTRPATFPALSAPPTRRARSPGPTSS